MQALLPKFLQPYYPLMVGIATAIGIMIVGWIVAKIIEKAVHKGTAKAKVDAALGRFLGSIARYAILVATIIAALGAVNVKTTSLVAIFASAGLAIGLALQGSLANFAAGVMILLFRPFSLGHFVTAGGKTGTVHDIGIFNLTLLTPDNEIQIIANKAVTGAVITNYTTQGTRRGNVEVGVEYGADIAKVIPVLEKAAKSAELVLEDPPPAIAFVGLGASSLDFKVFAWAESPNYLGMLHNVRTNVYDALNEAGIEIPFQQIVVHQDAEAEGDKKKAA